MSMPFGWPSTSVRFNVEGLPEREFVVRAESISARQQFVDCGVDTLTLALFREARHIVKAMTRAAGE